MYDSRDNRIEWKYIIELEKESHGNIFGQTHKITQRHIQWKSRPMHVRTAAETLSNSASDALEFLMNTGMNKFSNALPTINFIRTINNLFDIMNTMHVNENERNPFKNALYRENRAKVFEFFEGAKFYITSLKVWCPDSMRKQRLIDSRVRTGFRGLLVNIVSISNMYKEYVERIHWLLFFATYRISQDHLEMFFGRIRMANGCNDNPTCKQFIASYKKLGLQADLIVSKKSNITLRGEYHCQTNILNVSSTSKCKILVPVVEDESNASETVHVLHSPITNFEIKTADFAGIVFIANKIEQKLLFSGQIYCSQCRDALSVNEKVLDNVCVISGGSQPCYSTVRLCEMLEIASNQYKKNSGDLAAKYKTSVIDSVLNELNIDNLFPDGFGIDHPSDHKDFLIKFIMDQYIHIRNTYNARKINLSTETEYLRSKLRKDIHHLHQ